MTALFPQIKRPTQLDVSNLTMSRGDNILFKNLTASISSGDVLWIQGDNGIGKTTLLEALAGLCRPDAGQITWQQGDKPSSSRQLITYQPHGSFAKATLTAKEDLTFWAKLSQNIGLTEEALDVVGLTTRQSVLTQNLSAGQRRRLALAKLIISGKPIWIMDEPSAAMDKDGAILIDELISRNVKRGGSAIIASHGNPRKLSVSTRKLSLKAAS